MNATYCTESPTAFHNFKGDACRFCGMTRHDLRNIRNASGRAAIAECRRILTPGETVKHRATMAAVIGERP